MQVFERENAMEVVSSAVEDNDRSCHEFDKRSYSLVFCVGSAGSGKTTVLLEVAKKAIDRGDGVILMDFADGDKCTALDDALTPDQALALRLLARGLWNIPATAFPWPTNPRFALLLRVPAVIAAVCQARGWTNLVVLIDEYQKWRNSHEKPLPERKKELQNLIFRFGSVMRTDRRPWMTPAQQRNVSVTTCFFGTGTDHMHLRSFFNLYGFESVLLTPLSLEASIAALRDRLLIRFKNLDKRFEVVVDESPVRRAIAR